MEMTYGEYLKEEEAGKTVSSIPFFEELKRKNIRPEMGIEVYEPNTGGYSVFDADSLTEELEFYVLLDRDDLPFAPDPEDQDLPEEPGFFVEFRNLRQLLEFKVATNDYAVAALDSAFNQIFNRFFYIFNGQKIISNLEDVRICSLCNDDFVNQAIGSIKTLYQLHFLSFDDYQSAEFFLKDYQMKYYSFLLHRMP